MNLAVRDAHSALLGGLQEVARSRNCDFATDDEGGNRHRIWLVTDPAEKAVLTSILEQEPAAYVADGNHRSAAAASLGHEHFLAVFFPVSRMGLEPYNRLLKVGSVDTADYVVWRNNFNTTNFIPNDTTPEWVMEDDYMVWRENFGNAAGSAAGLDSNLGSAIPEPTTLATLLLGTITMLACGKRGRGA